MLPTISCAKVERERTVAAKTMRRELTVGRGVAMQDCLDCSNHAFAE